MTKIIECVPNFSEGKNKKTIDAIAKSISGIQGIRILDIHKDKDHNRSVITFIGEPEAVLQAAFQATKTAAKLIDLTKQKGVHPRIGATDVIPLIPIKNVSFKECVSYANELGKRIGSELHIPIYLYEKAAKISSRKNLANVRKKIATEKKLAPDFGPKRLGPAGATSIGVRDFLIAFNVNLKSSDLSIAKKIAKAIRESSDGLPYVKALGLELKSRKITQISMNLTNYKKTSPLKAFKKIQKQARKHKVQILESELIGCAPIQAMPDNPKKELKLTNLKPSQIINFNNSSLLTFPLK
jgi:glutamate formiminotransferase